MRRALSTTAHPTMATRITDEFVMHLLQLMAPLQALGTIRAKRMFGGHGVYCDDLIFALIARGALYLKTDDQTRALFEAERSEPFRYDRPGRVVTIASYYSAPLACLESSAEMQRWARRAIEASLRIANAQR
jgi:DNA transformation protein